MGGRRAADLTHLVGKAKTITSAKRELTSAVGGKDPKAIADASTRLVAKSQVGLTALRYGLKLSPYISENRETLFKQSVKDRSESLRRAWTSVKSKESLRTSREIDAAVISAASATFRKRK